MSAHNKIEVNQSHPHFKAWLQDLKKLTRPIINHENPSKLIINCPLPMELNEEKIVLNLQPLKQLPHLAQHDFMPTSPFSALPKPIIIAGPCSIESQEQLTKVGQFLNDNKLTFLRGGLFKPRSKHSSFQGLGYEGISLMQRFIENHPCQFVTEVMSIEQIEPLMPITSIFQIGARNMYNTPLLHAIGQQDKPVILKRALSATYEEWLNCAEYIINAGNPRVILCERGIRTFEPQSRNCLDVGAVPIVKSQSALPIIIDPSHACGNRDYVRPLAKAGIAAGADGLIFETHPYPDKALSDGMQSLDLEQASLLVNEIRRLWDHTLPLS